MPNVADELAALRAKGSVKTHASNLKDGTLSTPEAHAAAIKAKRENDKLGNMKAKEIVNKGSHGVSQEMEHSLGQTGKKKAELEKKNEAKKMLNKGGSAESNGKGGKKAAPQAQAVSVKKDESKRAPKKEEPAPKKEEPVAKKESTPAAPVETKEPASAPTPVETTATDDVPDLEEVNDAIPELEANATQQPSHQSEEDDQTAEERQITNRNEKKARKMMTRLNMRPVSNIARVTLKVGGNRGYFFIDSPDVFTSVGGKADTYVIFGEARQGGGFGGGAAGGGGVQGQAAAQQQAAMAAASAAGGGKGMVVPSVQEGEDDGEDVPELAASEGDAGGDEDGVEAKDIDLVMSQASCSRAKAVAALKENDGDLVNAIMSLTT